MMKKILGFIICILLITTAVFSVVGNDEKRNISIIEHSPPPTGLFEWPMFRYGLNNSGFSPSLAPDDNSVLWSKYIGDWVDSNPTLKDERLYIVGDNYWQQGGADLWCLDPFTGDEIWKTDLPNEFVFGSPTVANDRLYVLGVSTFNLYCVDAATGDILWTYPQHGHCSPMVVEDKVYFGSYGGPSNEGGFFCLNATSGDLIWSFDTTVNYEACTPAIVDGKVYVGNGWFLYCLNAETGEEIWNSPVKSYWGSPAVFNDRVYTSCNTFYCLDAEDGDELWSYPLSDYHCSPAIAYGNVYIGDDDKVYCFDPETGDLFWESISLGNMRNDVAVADEKVFIPVGGYDDLSKFVCLDAYTGEVLWDYPFGGTYWIYSAPAIAYGNVYVGNGENGYIYAFGTPNEPPGTPAQPDGPDEGRTGVEYTFNTYSTDPEEDDIYYLFDWGDGTDSGWIGPYASGEEVNASHIWTEIGIYEIMVKAHDGRRESNWSEPLTIHITSLPPDAPIIGGPTSGMPNTEYDFTFVSTDPEGDAVMYNVDWDDGDTEWTEYGDSGVEVILKHNWTSQGTFTIKAQAVDISGAESSWTEFPITIPKNKSFSFNFDFFEWLFERFPNAFPILRQLLVLLN